MTFGIGIVIGVVLVAGIIYGVYRLYKKLTGGM